MTRTVNIMIPWLLMLLLAQACAKPGQNSPGESAAIPAASPIPTRITSESVVKAAAEPAEISVGGSAGATVRVTIQSGYHINANPPSYPYLKATQLELTPSAGLSIGIVSYPKPLAKKFPFAEKPLAVYEGETEIKATLKADKSATPGQRSISGRLRIQACDDQVCYPPGMLEVAIPVNIK